MRRTVITSYIVLQAGMADAFTEARKRQLARLGGAKPPAPRAAMALAKSQAYQDAPATLRAYAADLANYKAWCDRHGFAAMPATPEVVGAYLAAAGEGYAMPTLRRRVAAIARTHAATPVIPSTPNILRSARRSAASDASMAVRRVEQQPSLRSRSASCAELAGRISQAPATGRCFSSASPARCADPNSSGWMWTT